MVLGGFLTVCTAFDMETDFAVNTIGLSRVGEILSLTSEYYIPLFLNQGSLCAMEYIETIPPLGRQADDGYNSSLDA